MSTRHSDNEVKSAEYSGSAVYVLLICIVAAIGGLLFGFDTAVVAGTIPFITKYFALSETMLGWTVSSVLVGCIFGASFSGSLSDRFGRKKALMLCAGLFAVSAIGSAIPRNLVQLVSARFVGGLGVGAAAMLSPMYIAEIAPARIRGRLVSLNQLAIVVGILVAYFVDFLLVDIPDTNWRWMFGSETLPAVVFLLSLLVVPESPRWLVKQRREDKAMAILSRVNGQERAKVEIGEIKNAIAEEKNTVGQLFSPEMKRPLVIGVMLAIFQQVTGINIIMYYAPKIFVSAGYTVNASLLQTVVVGAVNLSFTFVAIWLVDKVGRKVLLLIGSAGMGVFLTLLVANAFHYGRLEGPLVLLSLLGYIACFASSLGPVVWVVVSEIFPTCIRGRAMSIATVCLWAGNFLVSLTFPVMLEKLNSMVTFGVYAVMCGITFMFVLRFLPETRGKTLEEIQSYWLR